jgi:hypothetical protein
VCTAYLPILYARHCLLVTRLALRTGTIQILKCFSSILCMLFTNKPSFWITLSIKNAASSKHTQGQAILLCSDTDHWYRLIPFLSIVYVFVHDSVYRRAIAEAKQRWSFIGWVTKNVLYWAPPCFGRHVESLVPVAFAIRTGPAWWIMAHSPYL